MTRGTCPLRIAMVIAGFSLATVLFGSVNAYRQQKT